MVSDGAAQLVHSWSCLSNFLGSANDIRRILQRPFSPEEKTWKDQWLFLIYCKLIQYAGAAVCFRGLFFGQKQECIVNQEHLRETAPNSKCTLVHTCPYTWNTLWHHAVPSGMRMCYSPLKSQRLDFKFILKELDHNTAPSNSCSTYVSSYKIEFSIHFSFVFSLIKRILGWKNMRKIYW